MNKLLIAGILLIAIIATSATIGYSQNWFQTTTPPQLTPTPTPQPTATQQPTPTTQPTAQSATKPTPTAQPTPKPTPQPTKVSDMALTLEIYGNANMDDKIDTKDVTYLQNIISGANGQTRFADANYDGKIDATDIDQVNAIINGNVAKINLLDGNRQNITVTLPANRIVVEYIQNAEMVRVLGLENKVVGVDYCVDKLKSIYFPENAASIQSVGQMSSPDYEAVLNLNPDILLTFSNTTADKISKLPGVDVVFLGLYYPNVTKPEDSRFIQGVLKAGYIFNKVDKATEYANWLLSLTSSINAKASTITTEQEKSVFITNYPYPGSTGIKAYMTIDTLGQVCILSGGKNVASIIPTYFSAASYTVDDEWIISQNPDYIFLHTVAYQFNGQANPDPAQGLDVNDAASIKNCLQSYLSQTKYADLNAIKNNHVYIITGDFRNNAMGGTLGAVYMAKILYPNVFTDLNPQAIHQEYITRFLRLTYNLDNNGVFLYPAITVNGDTVGVPNGSP